MRKKLSAFALCAVLVLTLCACKPDNRPEENTSEPTNISVRKIDADSEWKLLLVNSSHPLHENFQVTVKSLPNEEAVDERVYPFLEKMLSDARAEGLEPVVCSSYRSYEYQSRLYKSKIKQYEKDGYDEKEAKKKAAAWVMPPGTSEHQAGLSVDIVDINHQLLDETQEKTPVSRWMKKNCAKYGFIVRYPTDKGEITGVNYEPWHYRYVGETAAAEIMKKGITLEEYLGQV